MVATTTCRSACVLLAAMLARAFALPTLVGSPKTPSERRSELPPTPSQPQLSAGVVAGAVTGVVAVLLVIGLGSFVIRRNRRRRNNSIGRTRSASPSGPSVRLEPTVRKPLVLNLASPARASFSFSPRRETGKAFPEPPVLSPISMTSPISPPCGVSPPSPVMKRPTETNLRRPRSLMSISSDFSLFYQPQQQTIHALTTPMPSPPPTRLTHSQNHSHSTTQKNSISDASRESVERRSRPSTATHATAGHGLRGASTSTAAAPQQQHHPTQDSWSMAVEELILRIEPGSPSPPPNLRASYAGKDNSPPSRSRITTAASEP